MFGFRKKSAGSHVLLSDSVGLLQQPVTSMEAACQREARWALAMTCGTPRYAV
jgi:hypothetical protein